MKKAQVARRGRCCWSAGLLTLLFLCGFASAQSPPVATLRLGFDQRGMVTAAVVVPSPNAEASQIQDVLEQTLGASLQNVRITPLARQGVALEGRAGPVLHHRPLRLALEGTIDPQPLLRHLHSLGLERLDVLLLGPDVSLAALVASAFPDPEGILPVQNEPRIYEPYTYDTADPSPAPLVANYSRPASDLQKLAPPLGILLLAFGVAFLLGKRILRQAEQDPYTAWYRQWHLERTLATITWVAWGLALGFCQVPRLAFFLAPGDGGGWTWGCLAAFLTLPPALTIAGIGFLSRNLQGRIPETGRTPADATRRALLGQARFVIPFLFLFAGLGSFLAADSVAKGVIGLLAALMAVVVLETNLAQTHKLRLALVDTGELFERTREIADNRSIRLKKVVFMPPSQWRLLNAIEGDPATIYLTPPLLEHLSRREIDALVAHQLLYLERKFGRFHGRSIAMYGLLWVCSTAMFLLWFRGMVDLDHWWPAVLFSAVALWANPWVAARRFAARFDLPSTDPTGDPEALMTALIKLSRRGLLPLTGNEGPSGTESLPSRRLERIASGSEIPPERVEELLAHPQSGADSYEPLLASQSEALADPGATGNGGLVLSPLAKARLLNRGPWWLIGSSAVIPVAIATLGRGLGLGPVGLLFCTLLAIPAAYAGFWVVQALRESHWLRQLRLALRQRLQSAGYGDLLDRGKFVGLAPGPTAGSYGGITEWDLGFLLLTRDRLCYLGDRLQFTLQRSDLRPFTLGPGLLSGSLSRRVFVAWDAGAGGSSGVFSLKMAEPGALVSLRNETVALTELLNQWRAGAMTSDETPEPLKTLTAPTFPEVVSDPLRAILPRQTAVLLLVMTVAFSGVLGVLTELRFDPSQGGEGLGAIVAAAVSLIVRFLTFRHR